MKIAKPTKMTILSLALLFFGYVMLRYVFVHLKIHYTLSLPFYIFIFCLCAILISALFNLKKLIICPSVGYNIGYIFGFIFNVDYIDEHGTSMDTWWIWFIVIVLASILIGIIWEFMCRKKTSN